MEELEIIGRIETILTTILLEYPEYFRRPEETCCHLDSRQRLVKTGVKKSKEEETKNIFEEKEDIKNARRNQSMSEEN